MVSLLSSLDSLAGEKDGLCAGGEEINVKPASPRVIISMASPDPAVAQPLLLAPTPPASTLSLAAAVAVAVAVAIGLRLYSKILFVFMVFVSSPVCDCDEEVELG